jgi:hypothetical protein
MLHTTRLRLIRVCNAKAPAACTHSSKHVHCYGQHLMEYSCSCVSDRSCPLLMASDCGPAWHLPSCPAHQ